MAGERSAYSLVEQMIVDSASATARAAIHHALDRVPLRALELCAQNGTRIYPLSRGEHYTKASPKLMDLAPRIDSTPHPPAGLFVIEERTLYLKSRSPLTIVHEFGHAVDCALGGGTYVTYADQHLQEAFQQQEKWVTPYQAMAPDEWFAEGFRAWLEVNDHRCPWPAVSRERLQSTSPALARFFDETFSDRQLALVPAREAVESLAPEPALAASTPEVAVAERAPSRNERRNDFYREITQDLIAVLESGSASRVSNELWQTVSHGLPYNPTTEQPYRGINVLRLALIARARAFGDPRWMTLRQANRRGWTVRAGERGTGIEVWQFHDHYTDAHGNPLAGKALAEALNDKSQTVEKERYGFCKFYAVFNAAQVDVKEQLPDGSVVSRPLVEAVPLIRAEQKWDPHERAERLVGALGVPVTHDGGNEAYYLPASDTIHLPQRAQFPSASNYYDTLLHEAGHATGHESRLNRDTLKAYSHDDRERAREELRAELTSLFVAAELGLPHNLERHADYIGSWARLLRENHMEIFDASRDAQAAKDFLLERERELEQNLERSPDHTLEAPQLSALVPGEALTGDQRRERFLAKIADLHDRSHAWSACMNEIRALKASYEISTVRRLLTAYRTELRARDPEHPALEFLRASAADQREVAADVRARIAERLKDLRAIDPERVGDAATQLLSGETFHELVAGVMLATGRRLPEVAHGAFGKLNDTYLDFSGAVKGSQRDLTIPSLVDPDLVLGAVGRLRALRPVAEMDVKQLNGSYSKTVRAAMVRALGDGYGDLKLDDARALYATVAYEWYGSPTLSIAAYHAEVLGHRPDEATSVLAKLKFFPVGKELETCERLEHTRLELISRLSYRLNDTELNDTARASIQQQLAELRSLTFDVRGSVTQQVGRPSRDGAVLREPHAPSQAPSLQNEVHTMPVNRGMLIGYPGKSVVFDNERGRLVKLGLKQTFGRGEERTDKWFDLTAREDVAARLQEALQGLAKGQMLKVDVELQRGSYKGRDDQQWHDTVELPVTAFEVVDKIQKGQTINRFELAGKVLDEPKLETLRSGEVATNVRLEVPGLKRGRDDQMRVRLFGEEARKFVAEVKQGQEVSVGGRLQISQFEDRQKVAQRRPELVVNTFGMDVAQQRAPVAQERSDSPVVAQPGPSAFQKQPYRVIPEQNLVVEFSRETGEVVASREATIVKRENLPYNLTGQIVAESLDGQQIYQELGKADVLELDKAAFDGRVPEVGDRVELHRGQDGREKAIFKDERQQQRTQQRHRQREAERDEGREVGVG
ncbi:DUF1738 domain-containing protein [bacterium]|nr:MAG: DUF1738 domain-containing protein [bacterium]